MNEVSAIIASAQPELFEILRNDGLDFSAEILEVGRFDLNGDGIDEIFVAVLHAYNCGTGGCMMFVLHRRDGVLEEWPGRMSILAGWAGALDLEVRLRKGEDGKWTSP